MAPKNKNFIHILRWKRCGILPFSVERKIWKKGQFLLPSGRKLGKRKEFVEKEGLSTNLPTNKQQSKKHKLFTCVFVESML